MSTETIYTRENPCKTRPPTEKDACSGLVQALYGGEWFYPYWHTVAGWYEDTQYNRKYVRDIRWAHHPQYENMTRSSSG